MRAHAWLLGMQDHSQLALQSSTCGAIGHPRRLQRLVDKGNQLRGIEVLCEVLQDDAQEGERICGLLRAAPALLRLCQQLHGVMRQLLEVLRGAIVEHCSAAQAAGSAHAVLLRLCAQPKAPAAIQLHATGHVG